MNRKPLNKEEFEYYCKKLPRTTVEVVLIHSGGVVLTKRSVPPDVGSWHIPGGSVMVGETLEDAVHAVAEQELGIEVEIIKFIDFFYYPKLLEQAGHWPIGAGFLIALKNGELKTNDDASEIKVFREIPENVISDQKEFLENLANNNFKI